MNLKRLLRNILLLPVLIAFAEGNKEPEYLEIPGTEGAEGENNIAVQFFLDQMNQQAPTQTIPQLNVGAAQQIPGLNVGAAQQIPLQGVAGLGANEQTVQNLLAKFLGTDATQGEAYQLGMGEMKKTLGGEFYDPSTSDFWKGYREKSEMEQEKGVSDIRRRGQLGGMLYSEPNMRTEADYIKGMGAERTMQLGSLYEKERDRKTSTVNQALGYAGFGEESMINKLNTGATIGAIPRQVENQKLEALFNQVFGQNQANYIQEGLQNQSVYNQQLGQSNADFAQQEAQNQSVFNQALGQSNADLASEWATIGLQTGAAEQMLPQWNIDEGGSSSGGFWDFLASIASIFIR